MNENKVSDKIDLIMRQTNYDEVTAEKKLTEHNDDAMQVIREYLNPGKATKICTTRLSVNQQIYKEIRGMMDDAAKTYLDNQKKQDA
jgi:CTP-dependent riboflavin kinase